jgi:DNA-binding NtrC family response regulator
MRPQDEAKKVLIVDADDLSRHVAARRLMRWGYDPILCRTSHEALALLRDGRYAALLADLHMQGIDGAALARSACTLQSDLPVFLMTAEPTPAQWALASAAGARDLLPKQAGSGDGLRRALDSACRERTPSHDGAEPDLPVAHALRTPLAALKGALDLLCSGRMGELPEAQRRVAAIAQRNADRMVALVEELLETSARA